MIEQAVRQLPPRWYDDRRPADLATLKTRRAGLVDYVLRVYRYYAKDVDVHATDRAEVVTLARGGDNSVEVTIAVADGTPTPYFRRRFLPCETKEVRVYLHGGNDRVDANRAGRRADPRPRHRRRRERRGRRFEERRHRRLDGRGHRRGACADSGTKVRGDVWVNPEPVKGAPWIEPRSFGHFTVGTAIVGYNPDAGARPRVRIHADRVGLPHQERGLVGADAPGRPRDERRVGAGRLLRHVPPARARTWRSGSRRSRRTSSVRTSSATATTRRTTPTEAVTGPAQNVFSAAPSLRHRARPALRGVRDSRAEVLAGGRGTELDPRRAPIPSAWATSGRSRSGAACASTPGSAPTSMPPRISPGACRSASEGQHVTGINIQASGFVVPKAWDVDAQYGGFDGVVAAYLGNSRAHLALRAGGGRSWATTTRGSMPPTSAAGTTGAS